MIHRPQHAHGWTLIELMTVLAIVALVTGFTVSGLSAATQATHANAAASKLLTSLTTARSRAASAGMEVVLCPSNDGRTCSGDYHWEGGWIAFADLDRDGDHGNDEPILQHQAALPPRLRLITSAGRTKIRFHPNGGNVGSNATFTLCDGRGPAKAVAYVMANQGTLRAGKPSTTAAREACSSH